MRNDTGRIAGKRFQVASVVALLIGILAGPAQAIPPRLPPMTEEEKKLDQLVDELCAKEDAEGLLLALEAASEMPSPTIGKINSKIISTLGKLKSVAAVDALIKKAEQSDIVAIQALGEIGDGRAVDALARVAQQASWKHVRHRALGAVAGIGGLRAREMVFETLANVTELSEVRLLALRVSREWVPPLKENEWRRILRLATNLDDPFASAILREAGRCDDPSVIGPLLEALPRLSALLEKAGEQPEDDNLEEKETNTSTEELRTLIRQLSQRVGYSEDDEFGKTATKAFLTGLASLERLARKFEKQAGYSVILRRDVSVLKEGKKQIRYEHTNLVNDAEQRKQVIAFWTAWWNENQASLVKTDGEAAARDREDQVAPPPEQRPKAGATVVMLIPEKKEFMLGEPVHVSFVIQNPSNRNLGIGRGQDCRTECGRRVSYVLRAVHEDGTAVGKRYGTPSGLLLDKTPRPGPTFSRKLFLPHWIQFKRRGEYTLTCKIRSLDLQAQAKVRVLPPDDAAFGEVIAKFGRDMFSDDIDLAQTAARSLTAIDDERVVPHFIKAVETGSYDLKHAALRSLAKFDSDLSLEALKEAMEIHGPDIEATHPGLAQFCAEMLRSAAASSLVRSRHPGARPFLISRRTDPAVGVRMAALNVVRTLKTPEALAILREMAKDKDERVRRTAKGYLEQLAKSKGK